MPISEVRTQIYLDKELHQSLKAFARARAVSMAQVVRDAVGAYMVREQKPLSEDLHQADPIWNLPEAGESFDGELRSDAAERHDDYLYGPVTT